MSGVQAGDGTQPGPSRCGNGAASGAKKAGWMIDRTVFGPLTGNSPNGAWRFIFSVAAVGCIVLALAACSAKANDRPTVIQPAIEPEYEPALVIAVRVALNRGSLTPWVSDNGRSGYVTVSARQSYGARECRNYRFTVRQDHQDWLSPVGFACRKGVDGEWDLHVDEE
jgi:hypothetical protein